MVASQDMVVRVKVEVDEPSLEHATTVIHEALALLLDPVYIKSTHPVGFRNGQWARVVRIVLLSPDDRPVRPCYVVRFIDGVEDQWAIYDEMEHYVFSATGWSDDAAAEG